MRRGFADFVLQLASALFQDDTQLPARGKDRCESAFVRLLGHLWRRPWEREGREGEKSERGEPHPGLVNDFAGL